MNVADLVLNRTHYQLLSSRKNKCNVMFWWHKHGVRVYEPYIVVVDALVNQEQTYSNYIMLYLIFLCIIILFNSRLLCSYIKKNLRLVQMKPKFSCCYHMIRTSTYLSKFSHSLWTNVFRYNKPYIQWIIYT